MSPAKALRDIFKAARPLIGEWLDVGEQIAALRDTATAQGLDWSAVKALLKAQIQDERDNNEGKRVTRILEKAEFASSYADMLGFTKMNEKNSFAEGAAITAQWEDPRHDAETGEIIEPPSAAPVPSGDAADRPGGSDEQSRSGATPSTAAGKDRPAPVRMTAGDAPQPEPQDRIGGSGNDPQAVISPAGTQAPPVDTLTEFERIEAEMVSQRLAQRPHCLRPKNCLGVQKKHCADCQQAYAEAQGFSA